MRRREFIGDLIGTVVAWPLAASAQQPAMPVIGLLSGTAADSDTLAPILRGLSEQGYVDGRNVGIEYRPADGHYDRLPTLATELVSMRVTVIATIEGSPSAIAAKAATSTIPIVFVVGVDPVERGLVASYSSPGGNVTGVTEVDRSLAPKQLELLDELLPKTALVAALVNPANQTTDAEITVGTTDMPGPSATSGGGLSMMSLTGTRWTILTKLPVAFWAGSSEKAVSDPG
jgi:putative ABC transport system substrate-binding protein